MMRPRRRQIERLAGVQLDLCEDRLLDTLEASRVGDSGVVDVGKVNNGRGLLCREPAVEGHHACAIDGLDAAYQRKPLEIGGACDDKALAATRKKIKVVGHVNVKRRVHSRASLGRHTNPRVDLCDSVLGNQRGRQRHFGREWNEHRRPLCGRALLDVDVQRRRRGAFRCGVLKHRKNVVKAKRAHDVGNAEAARRGQRLLRQHGHVGDALADVLRGPALNAPAELRKDALPNHDRGAGEHKVGPKPRRKCRVLKSLDLPVRAWETEPGVVVLHRGLERRNL
eukprot:Amastigsp_a339636_25.p2 type:complete len:282 gc:universal Amastigsp_a339636_25:1619-774(-)